MSKSKYNKKFEEEIRLFSVKTIQKMEQVRTLAVYQLFCDIVDQTPLYIKGSPLRGNTKWNWVVGIDQLRSEVLVGTDVGGKKTKERAYKQLQKVTGTEDIYISNSVPWIFKLEYGEYTPPNSERVAGGFSTQAPAGILRVTALKWNKILIENTNKVKNV